jgi:hypothetical protein
MGRQTEEMNLKYQLPDWLAYQAWEVGAYRDRSAWRINLQTYRVLPSDAPIFKAVEEGDLEHVRHLLATRASYPNDRNEYDGRTPLHVSKYFIQTLSFSVLLSQYERSRQNMAGLRFANCFSQKAQMLCRMMTETG